MKTETSQRPAERERLRPLRVGSARSPGGAVDLRAGLAGEIARESPHDPFRNRMGGRQDDQMVLQLRLRQLGRARQCADIRRHKTEKKLAVGLQDLPRLKVAPEKL